MTTHLSRCPIGIYLCDLESLPGGSWHLTKYKSYSWSTLHLNMALMNTDSEYLYRMISLRQSHHFAQFKNF